MSKAPAKGAHAEHHDDHDDHGHGHGGGGHDDHGGGHCPPPWIITFADMATLLMAFFVIMLMAAETDVPKFNAFASVMRQTFGRVPLDPNESDKGGTSILDLHFGPQSGEQTNDPPATSPQSGDPEVPDTGKAEGVDKPKGGEKGGDNPDGKSTQSQDGVEEAAKALAKAMSDAVANGELTVESEAGQVVVRLPSGTDKAAAEKIAQAISQAAKSAADAKAAKEGGAAQGDAQGETGAAAGAAAGADGQSGAAGGQDSGAVGQTEGQGAAGQAEGKGEAAAQGAAQGAAEATGQAAGQAAADAATEGDKAAGAAGAEAGNAAGAGSAGETGAGGMTGTAGTDSGDGTGGQSGTSEGAAGEAGAGAGTGGGTGAGTGAGVLRAKMAALKMGMIFDEQMADGSVDVEQRDGVVVVTVGAGGAFISGSSDMTAEAQGILEKLQQVSKKAKRIVVTGHTDNKPIQGGEYKDNWELGAARAASVVREITASGVMPDAELVATSKGETEPIASNDTEEGRAKNRRIEIEIEFEDGTKQ